MIPEHLAHLPVVRGMPVPYVAIWTGEQVPVHPTFTRNGLEPDPARPFNLAKEHGIWCIATPTKRTGRPLFGQTHSKRQRICMVEERCQVCGRDEVEGGGRRVWTIPPKLDAPALWAGANLTMNPPTCEECWGWLLSWQGQCPFVNEHKVPAFTGQSRAWGMWGDLPTMTGQSVQTTIPFGAPETRWMLGRQLVVQVPQPKRLLEKHLDPIAQFKIA
jgi:hypothetical protein